MESTMILTGYVGHNLEMRQTKTGVATVEFRVGNTPRYRTDNGWIDGTTTWMSVVCYRVLAEHVARSLSKGDPVIVCGKLRTQSWKDMQGVKHEKLVIEAGSIGHDLSRGVSAFARSRSYDGAGNGSDSTSGVQALEEDADEDFPMSDEEGDDLEGTGLDDKLA